VVIIETESRTLRKRLSILVAEAAKNESILRRSQARELTLLQSATLVELFDNLVNGLQQSFELDQVSLTLADPEHEIRHLMLFSNVEQADLDGVMFCDSLAEISPLFEHLTKPSLKSFRGDLHGVLFDSESSLASVAILPLTRGERIVGSLNFGSSDAKRFTRYHATDFLQHLAVIAGFCLENGVNRSKLTWAGLTDVLTGWHNRRYLEARLPEEFALAARGSDSVSLLMFDVDHFKRVNDEHGHDAGDKALREIALRVQKEIRLSDVAARWGGEEFVVVLPRTSLSEGIILAERVRSAVNRTPIRVNAKHSLSLSVSIGLSAVTPSEQQLGYDQQWRAALDQTDAAMYTAKRQGRNQVVLATT